MQGDVRMYMWNMHITNHKYLIHIYIYIWHVYMYINTQSALDVSQFYKVWWQMARAQVRC